MADEDRAEDFFRLTELHGANAKVPRGRTQSSSSYYSESESKHQQLVNFDESKNGSNVPQGQEEDAEDEGIDIMMLLDIDKVPALREEFEQKEEGLELSEFVYVMRKYLKRSSLSDAQLVSHLCELFAQIDVNGDGTMEWDEFTSYIVEAGTVERMNEPSSIRPYSLTSWVDDAKHPLPISACYYFPGIDRAAAFEARSNVLNLYNPETLNLERSLTIDGGQILAATHLMGRSAFAIANSNLCVSIYDDQSHREMFQFQSDTSQTCLNWSTYSQNLYSAGLNGIVHCWDLDAGVEKHSMGGVLNSTSYYIMKESHTDMVLDLLQITSLECLASASMDRTIRLWDVHSGRHKKTLEGHEKGVRSLAYNEDYRFMVSAGFDYDALVWNPYVEHLILRLHGHNAPLCKVEMIENSPQIITADTSGIFKVWDIRNFGCVQTFGLGTPETLQYFASITPNKTILAVGRHMYQFQYEKLKNPEKTNDLGTFAALVNGTTLTILTASPHDVRLWDAQKGTLLNRFRDLMEGAELTAVCLDDRQRKFIIGDHAGHIRVYDYMNGCEMKAFAYPERAHKSEVSALIYCNEHKIVISAGWDDCIILHDEMNPEKGIQLRKLEGGHFGADITALAFSHKLSMIASGSPCAEAPIVLWDFEFGRVEAVLLQDPEQPAPRMSSSGAHPQSSSKNGIRPSRRLASKTITALEFIDIGFPGLVSADDAGGLVFWAVRPATVWRNRQLARVLNHHDTQATAISAVCLAQELYQIFTADEKGYVKIWDYAPLVSKVHEELGSFKPHECENARRRIHMDVSTKGPLMKHRKQRAPSVSGADYSDGPTGPNCTSSTVFRGSDVVLQLHSWEAHRDGIQHMQLVCDHNHSCLITAANDCLVRVWDLKGNPLGTLRQGDQLMGKDWHLKVDIASRNAKRLEYAEGILSEMNELEVEFAAARAALENEDGDSDDDNSSHFHAADSHGASFIVRRNQGQQNNKNSLAESKLEPEPYQRRTPRLAPVDARMAGRGYSNTLRGRRYRAELAKRK